MIPDAPSRNGTDAEDLALRTEIRAIASREHQPVTDELLESRGHTEVLPNDGGQSIGVPDVPHQRANMKQFRNIGDAVAVSQRSRGDPDEGAHVGEVMIL